MSEKSKSSREARIFGLVVMTAVSVWMWYLGFSSLESGEVIEGKNGRIWNPVFFWIVAILFLGISLRLLYRMWRPSSSERDVRHRWLNFFASAVFLVLAIGQFVAGYAQSLALELEENQ